MEKNAMIITIDTETTDIVAYAYVGGKIGTNGTFLSFESDGVIPEPLHHFEAYDSDGWKVRKKSTDTLENESNSLVSLYE